MTFKTEIIRKQASKCFKKALKKHGYISLRSITESQYRFPQQWVIEPIRQPTLADYFNQQ